VIDIDRSRLRPTIASSMLGVCSAPGCTTIVFGLGTCVEHDTPQLQRADALLDEGIGGRASLAADVRPRQTIEP
jgi:hypothetical protein